MSNLLVLLVGIFIGWLWAHGEISSECKRQGGFYVGKTDFACSVKVKP